MKILLIGCGKMGAAMMNGWLKSGVKKADIKIVDPFYKGAYKSIADLPATYEPEYVFLAIKPQTLPEISADLKKFGKAIFISIMAGKSIAVIGKDLPKSAVIVRTMPNLPALIGQGITAAICNRKLAPAKQRQVNKLLEACGKVVWLKKEELLDSVTAISGSGPAYVFLFMQKLIDAAIELGLDAKTSKTLVFETVKGSLGLAETSKDSLEQLKINVTSKGGTTAAALAILEKKEALKKLVLNAAKAAKQRAKVLSK